MSGKENRLPLKYKKLDDLKQFYDRLNLTGQDPRKLMLKLDMMFEKASESMKRGDQEEAYILFMKYLSVFSFIQRSENYKSDSKYYKAMLGKKPANAVEIAEKLHSALQESYKSLASSESRERILRELETNSISKNAVEVRDVDMRVKRETKSMLSSAKLFNMLKDGVSKVLIMDARPETDFESSKIKEESLVNIPDEIITKGKSAHVLEQNISDAGRELWKLRGTYDQIILLDWNSNEQTFDASKLSILKEILTKWDVNTNYKNEILILDGGYDDWISSYPWYTTNPNPVRPFIEDIALDPALDQVIYPDLDDVTSNVDQELLKPFFDRSKKPLKRTLTDVDYTGVEEVSEKASQISRPSFDRAKKAAAIRTYEERKADMANLLNQKKIETSAAVELEKTMIDNERELQETIRKQKDFEADEDQKRLLEEQEEKLLMKVEELKEESIVKDNKIKELEKIIEIYEKRDVEEASRKEVDEERISSEAEINEQIRIQEEEKKKLAKEREEMENTKELEMSVLKEKYKEKLEQARVNKKKQFENDINSSTIQENILKDNLNKLLVTPQVNESSNRVPIINRNNKPKYEERVRQFSGVRGKVGRGLTGLKNLGNTCYMNSIIQCISNNSALARYFCGNHYRDDVNRWNKTKGEVAEELAVVIKTLWSGHFRSIACRDLKYVVGLLKPEYGTYEQQDSHEFLTFLMDWLHNDLNKVRNPHSPNEERITDEVEKAWWEFKKKNDSLISTLFFGLQKSTVACLKCGEESVTYEPFSNLSLIIPESDSSSLESCLRLYLKSERISGWRCPKCQELREAEKKTDICRLPHILVIHLKRFHYIEVLSRKRTTYVDFPLNELNMSQYTINHKLPRNHNYSLYAVSNHYGTMEGGHYTAFCKSTLFNKWYKFDDHEVFEMSPSEVKTNAAYILFYSSIRYNVPDPIS